MVRKFLFCVGVLFGLSVVIPLASQGDDGPGNPGPNPVPVSLCFEYSGTWTCDGYYGSPAGPGCFLGGTCDAMDNCSLTGSSQDESGGMGTSYNLVEEVDYPQGNEISLQSHLVTCRSWRFCETACETAFPGIVPMHCTSSIWIPAIYDVYMNPILGNACNPL
jgi:hypothetical protein